MLERTNRIVLSHDENMIVCNADLIEIIYETIQSLGNQSRSQNEINHRGNPPPDLTKVVDMSG